MRSLSNIGITPVLRTDLCRHQNTALY